MNAETVVVSCPQRAAVLERTLSHLARTDWKERPYVQMDTSVSADPKQRQTDNFLAALKHFSSRGAQRHLLLLEDDLFFNLHLKNNLERWSPYLEGTLNFGSLYNPNIRALRDGPDYFIADPNACYGSQAYVLSLDAVSILLREWHSVPGMQDIKITRILAAHGYPLHYHKPSLVQHVGTESAWGGGFHQAQDFQPEWQSHFDHERIPGWFTFPHFYQQAVAEASDGDRLVEVGAWLGRSTAYLARAVKVSNKRINVLVVDTFRGSDNEPSLVDSVKKAGGSVRPLFERNMKLAGVLDQLDIMEAPSTDAASAVEDHSCRLVFIDADHRYASVRADIRSWLPKVRRGGLLAGHDCHTYADVFNAVRDELGSSVTMTQENVWIYRIP